VGLGHDFLKHIVRCKLLVFVLDTAGSEGRNPIEDLGSLRRELDLYDPSLSLRPWMIVANKMDLPEAAQNLSIIRDRFKDKLVFSMSAANGEGTKQFVQSLEQFLIR
jgi:GTP-binding protein